MSIFWLKIGPSWSFGGNVGLLETNLNQHKGILRPTWANLEPCGAILEATWSNMSQHGANMSQHGANMEPTWRQHGANMEPTWGQLEGWGMSLLGGFFRGSQLGANMAQLEPTWSQFGPTWPQLEPTSSQLGSKLDPFCLKKANLKQCWSYLT